MVMALHRGNIGKIRHVPGAMRGIHGIVLNFSCVFLVCSLCTAIPYKSGG